MDKVRVRVAFMNPVPVLLTDPQQVYEGTTIDLDVWERYREFEAQARWWREALEELDDAIFYKGAE